MRWLMAIFLFIFSWPQGWAGESGEPADLASYLIEVSGVRTGLCLHLGCADGRLAEALARQGNFLVQGLAFGDGALKASREFIQGRGLYGQVSVDRAADPARLPYGNHLVNLAVVHDIDQVGVECLKEVVRVLAPYGVALMGQEKPSLKEEELKAKAEAAGMKETGILRQRGLWLLYRKPYPAEMDEWTHNNHGPDGNYVSKDKLVAPPVHLQWLSGPLWPMGGFTSADRKSGVYDTVSSGGRNFYFTIDEDPSLPPTVRLARHVLVARNAFNGLVLWRKDLGPSPEQNRNTFVAAGGRVFGTFGPNGALAALRADSGEVERTFEIPGKLVKVLCHRAFLVVLSDSDIRAFNSGNGSLIWKHDLAARNGAISGERVIAETSSALTCLDLAKGALLWEVKKRHEFRFCAEDVAVLATSSKDFTKIEMEAFSATDGKPLWNRSEPLKSRAYASLFGVQGRIWIPVDDPDTGREGGLNRHYALFGFNLRTGAPEKSYKAVGRSYVANTAGCGRRPAATERFLLGGKLLGFWYLDTNELVDVLVVRGGCSGGGLVPANGLIYAFPKACMCYSETQIRGYLALASKEFAGEIPPADRPYVRLEKGPAYGMGPSNGDSGRASWPTFRHNSARSGASPASVPPKLQVSWAARIEKPSGSLPFPPPCHCAPGQRCPRCVQAGTSPLLAREWASDPLRGGPVSAPVAADGTVYVSLPESHRVVALDGETGKERWSFTTGGRIDVPPTIHQDLCLVGCRDGWVYCLHCPDGALAWRFHPGRQERKLVAFGQLESATPVVGGVLVEDNVAYGVAGRTDLLDGGIVNFALASRTGAVIWEKQGGKLPDLPRSEPGCIVLSRMCDPKTGEDVKKTNPLYKATPFLLDRSWHFGVANKGSYQLANGLSAKLLVFDAKDQCFGYGVGKNIDSVIQAKGEGLSWTAEVPAPASIEALALTRDLLFAAGPVDRLKRDKGFLWALSRTTGKKVGEWPLAKPPAAEGLAAVEGRLYVSLENGEVVCFAE